MSNYGDTVILRHKRTISQNMDELSPGLDVRGDLIISMGQFKYSNQ